MQTWCRQYTTYVTDGGERDASNGGSPTLVVVTVINKEAAATSINISIALE